MSAKYFCDNCFNEMKESDHDRIRISGRNIQIEVMAGFNGLNSGHLCHKCIVDAIIKLKSTKPITERKSKT